MNKRTARISKLLLFTIALCAMSSCLTDDIPAKQYTISAKFGNADSRVDYTYQTTSDNKRQIGVTWSATDKMDIYTGSISSATKSNPAFSLSAGAGTHDGTFTGGTLKGTLTSGTTPLYAFIEKSNISVNETNSSITVDFTGQKGTLADATSRDVLFSSTTYNEQASPSFSFAHKMAIVKLTFNIPEAGTADILLSNRTESSISKLYTSVTYDAASGSRTNFTQADQLTLSKVNVVKGNNDFYICLYPQSVIGLYATISLNGNNYTAQLQNSALSLTAGQMYSSSYTFFTPTLYIKSSKSKPVTLIVSSAEFTDTDLAPGGLFETKAKAAIDYLFSVEPYKSYKDYFNVYIIPAHSSDLGYVGTLKGTDYSYTFKPAKSLIYMVYNCPDLYNDKFDYTKVAVSVLVNTQNYFGLTHSYSSGYAFAFSPIIDRTISWPGNNGNVATNTGDFRNIFIHEFGGHAFARLLDEYWYDDTKTYSGTSIEDEHAWSIPFGKNIVTANEAKTSYYWDHMIAGIGTGTTFPKEARTYEGGGAAYGKGVYRPEQISIMDDNRPYFNAYSRQLIVERILGFAGETFDYETFCKKDVNYDPVAKSAKLPINANIKLMPHMSPPVFSNEKPPVIHK
jgi:hypothetical protein